MFGVMLVLTSVFGGSTLGRCSSFGLYCGEYGRLRERDRLRLGLRFLSRAPCLSLDEDLLYEPDDRDGPRLEKLRRLRFREEMLRPRSMLLDLERRDDSLDPRRPRFFVFSQNANDHP
jgi:hypothetical protein